jgi:hypothetical protein
MTTPRTPFAAMLDALDWQPAGPEPDPDGLPTVTHRGVLTIAGVELHVFRLSDGRRVVDPTNLARLLGYETEGGGTC